MSIERTYRGRLAPSPTGYLHLGHARTFWSAAERARQAGGVLVFRNEDLDPQRSRPAFVRAMYEDLRWLGLEWQEGPDISSKPRGGPFGPYSQSERREWYVDVWRKLRDAGAIYPCTCSRRDLAQAAQAPHEDAGEAAYPGTCRDRFAAADWESPTQRRRDAAVTAGGTPALPVSWRFRAPDGAPIRFEDALAGPQEYVAGRAFGDFLVWRRDDVPAYQLACVADDAAMRITEVVRGADLLKSTARQLLLYKALGLEPPTWAHAALVTDEQGVRLAKRHDALSLRALREAGKTPAQVRAKFGL